MTRLTNTWYGEPHSSTTTSWRRSMPDQLLEDDPHMYNIRRSHAFPSDVRASARKYGPVWSSVNDGSDAQSASTSSSGYSWQQSVIFRPLDTGSSDSDDSHISHGSDKCPSLNMPGAFPANAIDNVEEVFTESEGPETLQVVFVPSSSFISLRGTIHADDDKSVYSSEQKSSDAIMDAPTIVEFVPKPPPPKLVTCVICFDDHQDDAMLTVEPCRHRFCSRCLRSHIDAKLHSRQYPVVCPLCSSNGSRKQSTFSTAFMQTVGMSEKSKKILKKLQQDRYSILIHCRRCDRETFIDRHDYDAAVVITCPFSGCAHSWCKQCSAAVNPRSPGHSCGAKAATKALERLMEKQGWKHCPGCRTPTSKSEGCNHMTCVTPGCNTHFCYVCGKSIARSTSQREVGQAILTHYAECAPPRSIRRSRIVRLVTPNRLTQLFEFNLHIRNPFRRRA